jgi:hypothetical protein
LSTITEFEAARQQAESIRLFLERLAGAEAALQLAIQAQQFLDTVEATRHQLESEQATLQAARNELEEDLAELRAQKQDMVDQIVAEGTAQLHARQGELREGIASLEQERLHAANAFELEVRERTATIADLMAEEDRLHKLCLKHRSQLGRVKAEVLRVLSDEEAG